MRSTRMFETAAYVGQSRASLELLSAELDHKMIAFESKERSCKRLPLLFKACRHVARLVHCLVMLARHELRSVGNGQPGNYRVIQNSNVASIQLRGAAPDR